MAGKPHLDDLDPITSPEARSMLGQQYRDELKYYAKLRSLGVNMNSIPDRTPLFVATEIVLTGIRKKAVEANGRDFILARKHEYGVESDLDLALILAKIQLNKVAAEQIKDSFTDLMNGTDLKAADLKKNSLRKLKGSALAE